MKRFSPPHFIVVVDTNALYYQEPTNVVSPKFEPIWNQCNDITTLSLVVPEVVKGERLFQLVTLAQQSIETISSHFEKLQTIEAGPIF